MKSFFFALVLLPCLAFAQAQVFPTRLTLTEENPSSYLTLRNPSAKSQKFKIEILELAMKKDGSVVPAKGEHPLLLDGIKYSPKTVDVAANEKQTVRVMMTSFDGLPEGESHIYLHFVPIGDTETKTAAKLSLQARIAVAVPIIVRHGSPKLDAKMKSPKVIKDAQGNFKVSFEVTNTTPYFLTGDLEVLALTPKGEVSLSKVLSISSYLPSRIVTLDLKKEDVATKLASEEASKFKIRYVSNEESAAPFDLTSEVVPEAKTATTKTKSSKRR